MSNTVIILLLGLLIMTLIVLYIIKMRRPNDNSLCSPRIFQFNSTFNNEDKSEDLSPPFSELVKEYNIDKVDQFKDANLIFFTDYTLYDQNFSKIKYKDSCNYKIFAIHGVDLLANKKILSEKLRGTQYVPISYSLDVPSDIEKLKANHNESNMYILKKNVQRQEGMKITKDIDFITTQALKEGFIVCQELLQDPMLVNKRKINLRIYLLIILKRNLCDFYIYNNGFIYYTPKYFEKGNMDKDVNITTGYIDRKVYDENPLTIQDLFKHIGPEKSKKLKANMEKCFHKIHDIYKEDLIKLNKKTPGLKYVIMGCDIAPNENLDIMIHEVNKGPDLSYKDERDKEVKYNLVKDTFNLLGVIKEGDYTNFVEINN